MLKIYSVSVHAPFFVVALKYQVHMYNLMQQLVYLFETQNTHCS